MNLIVTTSCNKNCSFCFAKDTLDDNEMTVDDVKSLIGRTYPDLPIKLIGGEPTRNTHFLEILEYLKTVENPLVLISNFIFNKEILDALKVFSEVKGLNCLTNVSEMSDGTFDLVSKNIESLTESGAKIKLGYTVMPDNKFSYYEEFLNKYKDILKDNFTEARISLPLPNPEVDYESMYFYHNYEYVDMIIKFIKWGMKNSVKFNLDCGLYPCMIKDDSTKKYLENWLTDFKFGCFEKDGIPPADVIDTNTVQYCYPGKNVRVDMSKHDDMRSVYAELNLRKNLKLLKGLPQECKECEFFNKECKGPCLGFL